jgi:hypothetical protein
MPPARIELAHAVLETAGHHCDLQGRTPSPHPRAPLVAQASADSLVHGWEWLSNERPSGRPVKLSMLTESSGPGPGQGGPLNRRRMRGLRMHAESLAAGGESTAICAHSGDGGPIDRAYGNGARAKVTTHVDPRPDRADGRALDAEPIAADWRSAPSRPGRRPSRARRQLRSAPWESERT